MTTAISIWLTGIAGIVWYAGWSAKGIAAGAPAWPYVLGLPFVYVGVFAAVTLLWFGLSWFFRARRPDNVRLGIMQGLRLYWGEVRAIRQSAPRMALYRWLMRDPSPAPARLPVILVHGVLCNSGAMYGLRQALEARGIGPIYSISYGPPLASIEYFADQLRAKIDKIVEATGATKVAIVGHSMGGLVARAYLRRFGAERIASIMTLGTPHHGSVLAWICPGVCLDQLRPGNAWLAELNKSEGQPQPVRMVSLWSWHDSMVAPQTSSRLDGVENIELPGIAHNALLGSDRVIDEVAKELAAVQRADGAGRPELPSAERDARRDLTNVSPG